MLNAPTSEAWIDPWEAHLRGLGVRFELGSEVKELVYENGRITGIRLMDMATGTVRTATVDHYLSSAGAGAAAGPGQAPLQRRPAQRLRPRLIRRTAMRKIVLMMSVSLDGYIEGPDREIDWHLVDDELHSHFNEQLRAMGAFLNGRVTHELMAGFWPTADADPSSTGPMAEFARIWRDMPKIVYSRTLERADWNTTVVRDVVVDEVMELKAQPGGDLALGGTDLAAAFLEHDLIDEYRLYVHPVLIGRGKPLFRASDAWINLRLAETRAFGNGVVLLHYQRGEASASG